MISLLASAAGHTQDASTESCSLKVEHKVHGKFHVKQNIRSRPIEYKYCEGNVKRTLKRELKVFEIAGKEVIARPEHIERARQVLLEVLFQWTLDIYHHFEGTSEWLRPDCGWVRVLIRKFKR